MNTQMSVWIMNEWDIIEARSQGKNAAKALGFNSADQAKITVTISELARNIYKYARRGQIHLNPIQDGDRIGLQVIAADRGPGMDVSKVMLDGYSTSGGLGSGLPGAKRLMDDFEVKSCADEGTVITTTKWLQANPGKGA